VGTRHTEPATISTPVRPSPDRRVCHIVERGPRGQRRRHRPTAPRRGRAGAVLRPGATGESPHGERDDETVRGGHRRWRLRLAGRTTARGLGSNMIAAWVGRNASGTGCARRAYERREEDSLARESLIAFGEDGHVAQRAGFGCGFGK
jgi:hypothetical protein